MMDKKDVKPEWEVEERLARNAYWWLLLSPFVTVPCFACWVLELLYSPTAGERVWAAVVPLIFHVPLLLMSFGAGNRFVRRHMQQALLLIALRAGMAAISLNLGRYPAEGLWLFFLGNGALWLFGSLWGFRQVNRGDCWLMRWKGEDDELPRPWAVPAGAPVSPTPAAHSPFEALADPNAAIERGRALLNQGEWEAAVTHFLAAFRDGPPDLRRRALAELEKLGEVETF